MSEKSELIYRSHILKIVISALQKLRENFDDLTDEDDVDKIINEQVSTYISTRGIKIPEKRLYLAVKREIVAKLKANKESRPKFNAKEFFINEQEQAAYDRVVETIDSNYKSGKYDGESPSVIINDVTEEIVNEFNSDSLDLSNTKLEIGMRYVFIKISELNKNSIFTEEALPRDDQQIKENGNPTLEEMMRKIDEFGVKVSDSNDMIKKMLNEGRRPWITGPLWTGDVVLGIKNTVNIQGQIGPKVEVDTKGVAEEFFKFLKRVLFGIE